MNLGLVSVLSGKYGQGYYFVEEDAFSGFYTLFQCCILMNRTVGRHAVPRGFIMLKKPQESSSASLLRQNTTAANQICRSALGNSLDIKNAHKWIATASRNPCQPHTQPEVLGWVDYSV